MKTKTIRQSVTFRTSPHVLYEMLICTTYRQNLGR